MAALPLWQKVLAPAAGTGVDVSNPKISSALTIGALAEGKITYNDALGLQVMYSNGLELTNMSRNFISTGMPRGENYNVKVASTTFGSTDTLNIVDARSWATHLNKSIAQQAAIQGSINARTNLFGGTQLKSRGQ